MEFILKESYTNFILISGNYRNLQIKIKIKMRWDFLSFVHFSN